MWLYIEKGDLLVADITVYRNEKLSIVAPQRSSNESLSESEPDIVCMVHAYTDNMATILKQNFTAAYMVCLELLYFLTHFKQNLIDHSYTVAGLLSFSATNLSNRRERLIYRKECFVSSSNFFRKNFQCLTYSKHSKDFKLYILYNAWTQVLRLLCSLLHRGLAQIVSRRLRRCHWVIFLYCW